ncbi:MAG: hypothetical protein HWD86_00960 [Kangiellaceae bacterium]|nr:hypothetical protein [Kangiellaceae bacterium]
MKDKKNIRTLVEEHIRDKLPDYIELSPKVPQEDLENFKQNSHQQKQKILSTITVTADDIAHFMKDPEVNDQDILLLLNSLNDVNEITAAQSRSPLTLIDHAALHSRAEVFHHLLDKGAPLTQDNYLGNTLEIALHALIKDVNNKNTVQIVKTLIAKGMEIRLDKNWLEQENYYGHGSVLANKHYFFSQDDLSKIKKLHSLDIQSIPIRKSLLQEEKHNRLKNALQQEKDTLLAKELGDSDVVKYYKHCENYLSDLNKKIRYKDPNQLIAEYKKLYSNDIHSITSALSFIDPSLVDCYIKREKGNNRSQLPNDKRLNRIWRLASQKQYNEAIDLANTIELNNKQRNQFFFELFRFDRDTLIILKDHGYIPKQFSFSDLVLYQKNISSKDIEALQKVGMDTLYGDSNGLSMMYYAVIKNNLSLQNYLIEEGYPYKTKEYGEDPLHAALNSQRMLYKDKDLVEIVKALKPDTRTIDEHHLSRMFVIKLKYPEIYEELTELYPVLTINEETKAPTSICSML